uniref:ANK_REP_REGION domain-containing protein n=1 Tax=Gongylonema pulchrum TaxID=637853 RepID=A0A183DUT0_9BILA
LILYGRIDGDNCLLLYEFAARNDLERLREETGRVVKVRWKQFEDDFANLPAPILYRLVNRFVDVNFELPQLCNEEVENTYPLELALTLNQEEIASALVDHHANVNIVDANGETLLMRLLRKNRVDALNFLLQNGAEINHRVQKTGKNLLHIAASTKCSKELLDWTPLLYAVELENVDVVQLFLKNSLIDVNITDQKGRSPISCALFEVKNMAIAEMIAATAGADLDIKYAGTYLIHYAVKIGSLDAVRLLCEKRADVNKKTSEGLVPLQLAIDSEHFDARLVRLLVDAGASVSQKISNSNITLLQHLFLDEILATMHATSGSCTPFSEAVLLGKFQCAELLLRVGADVNECDPNGKSLLMRAVSAGLDDAAVFLLDHGANLSEKSVLKCHILLFYCSFEVARILVENGCDLDACSDDPGCRTLLHKAIRLGLRDAAIFLIEKGCDIDAPVQDCDNQSSGDTPLLACIRSGFYDVARCLVERGARLDKQMQNSAILNVILSNCNPSLLLVVDRNGNTPLHLAWMAKNYPIADALIKKAPDLVTQFDRDGDTLLHKAVKTADLEWILFLISANSDVNSPTRNPSHLTALHISAQSGSEIIMRNLVGLKIFFMAFLMTRKVMGVSI